MMITKILIGIDDSKYAEHAAAYGFDIARKFNASIGLVNIIEPVILPPATTGTDPLMNNSFENTGIAELEMMAIQNNHAADVIESTIKKFGEGIQVSHFTGFGSTADGIIDCAKEFGADLIVVGTHKRSGLNRLLEGSVAEHVVRHAEVPVLVVPFKSESQ